MHADADADPITALHKRMPLLQVPVLELAGHVKQSVLPVEALY